METDELSTSKQTSSALGQRLTSDLRRFVAMKVARKCTKPSIGEKWVETMRKGHGFWVCHGMSKTTTHIVF